MSGSARVGPPRGLSIADQQLVEIAKALSFDARVLIMDEPTAALSGGEVERLFGVARSLCERGAAMLFISHRFDEVFDLCQRITVLRDGAWVSSDSAAALTVDDVVRRMVGRDVSSLYPKQDAPLRDTLLEVRGAQPGRRLLRRVLLGKDGVVVLGPPTVFAKSNIDQFQF
ncbi:hypothetical protein [Micromonospora okii]|uniref:hypothetical protein n=1 Tax=Micromonospora okii TaxID=1182970 RepID=UPI001E61CB15|nr:hypothetical protein [Micromonospora okii]